MGVLWIDRVDIEPTPHPVRYQCVGTAGTIEDALPGEIALFQHFCSGIRPMYGRRSRMIEAESHDPIITTRSEAKEQAAPEGGGLCVSSQCGRMTDSAGTWSPVADDDQDVIGCDGAVVVDVAITTVAEVADGHEEILDCDALVAVDVAIAWGLRCTLDVLDHERIDTRLDDGLGITQIETVNRTRIWAVAGRKSSTL